MSWLEEAKLFIDQYQLDLDRGGCNNVAQALCNACDCNLANVLFEAEGLLSRVSETEDDFFRLRGFCGLLVVECRSSRVTRRRSRRLASLCCWKRRVDAVVVPRNMEEARVATILRKASRQLRCEGDRRLALQHPRLEVFQGVTFKWKMAAILAHLSQFVYEISDLDDNNKKRWAANKCKEWIVDDNLDIGFFHSSRAHTTADNAVLIVQTVSDIYVVFRGTVSWVNWRQKFTLGSKPFPISNRFGAPAGKVHGGFFDAQDSIWPKLRGYVDLQQQQQQQQQQARNMWIAGHSLGGAMAIITAARLVTELKVERIDGVYTFGGPCLFSRTAVAQYCDHPVLKGRTFRVKNGSDYVPRGLVTFYQSPGVPIRVTTRDGMSADKRRLNDQNRLTEHAAQGLVSNVRAHGMERSYVTAIDRVAAQAGTGTV